MNQHITQKAVDGLEPPASGYYIVFDDKLAGFGVRVMASGVKSFVYDYRVGGKQRRYTIGRFGKAQWSVAPARDKVEELGPDIRSKGADPAGEKKAEREAPTMDDLATDYMDLVKKSDKSIYEDRRMLNKIILPKLGKLRVKAVTRRNVKTLHNSLRKTPYQANRVLALLSNMFTFAMDDNMRPDNPAKGIKRCKEDKRDTWFSVDQLHALSDALDSYDEQDAADALRLLIVTGARPGEVIGATWPMFDLKRGVWTKPSHHTKERKIEHVRLNGNAMAILRRMAENKGAGIYLFPGRDPNTARTTLRNAWKQVCKSAGFATVSYKIGKRGKPLERWKPSVRIYQLRHTFASILISRNWSLQLVGKLLGHTQTATTERYAHVADSAQQDATNDFDNVIMLPARSA